MEVIKEKFLQLRREEIKKRRGNLSCKKND